MGREYFREVQYFHWLVNLLLAGVILLLLERFLRQEDLVAGGILLLLLFSIALLFRMETVIDEEAVTVTFGWLGWIRKRLPLADIASYEVVTFNPLWDFGGWGIRYGRGGVRCYNTQGNRGVRLTTSRQTIVIGSQRPEELAVALRAALAEGGGGET
ncbi:MAG TPA: hypothetical protein EYP85_12510 [Armatimonadetes bacterium]|nr:hypothetical protein [Armatimonadota bacterium]